MYSSTLSGSPENQLHEGFGGVEEANTQDQFTEQKGEKRLAKSDKWDGDEEQQWTR
jgi:hypothetical protein